MAGEWNWGPGLDVMNDEVGGASRCQGHSLHIIEDVHYVPTVRCEDPCTVQYSALGLIRRGLAS